MRAFQPAARLFSRCVVIVQTVLLIGCGDGLDRRRVAGIVTYKGQPVDKGTIFFEPTESVGKIAPTVYLPIREGKYDTGPQGPIPGRYKVIVGGIREGSSRVDDDGITHTDQLFPDYKFEVDIPPPNGILDIEVPAAKSGKAKS
jgi:hypothetical protein